MADEVLTKQVFTVEDKASSAAEKIGRSFGAIDRLASGASARLASFGRSAAYATAGAVGLGFGFGALKDKILGANLELGKVQKNLGGALFAFQSWNKSISQVNRITIAMREAKEVTKQLEDQETRLALPLEELGNTYRTIAGPAFQKLGMDQKQVMALTIKAAEAAKVFGVSGEQAASTLVRAFRGQLPRSTDPFAEKLRALVGNTKKLGAPEIYRRIDKGLRDLAPAADAMSHGLADSIFRLKDLFEDTLRDVGAPTIKYIGGLLQRLNSHLEDTNVEGKKFADIYGERLLTAFKFIEKTSMFIADHWKGIVASIAAFKVAGALGKTGVAGSLISKVTGGAVGGTSVAAMSVKAGVVHVSGPAGGALDSLMKGSSGAREVDFGGGGAPGKKTGFLGRLWGGVKGAAGAAAGVATGALGASSLLRGGVTGLAAGAAGAAGLGIGTAGMALYNRFFTEQGRKTGDISKSWTLAAGELKDSVKFWGQEMGLVARDFKGAALALPALPAGGGVFAPGMMPGEVVRQGWRSGPEEDVHPVNKKGPRITNIYGGVKITQDFKDQDPDRIAVMFKNTMEGLAENKKQSNQSDTFGA